MWNRLKDLYWNKISGYIEEQIFTLFIFFSFWFLLLGIFLEIVGLYSIYDLILMLYVAASVILSFIKLFKELSKYGKHSFLTYELVANYSVKYTGVYIETLLVMVFMYIAFDFIRQTNSDAIGLLLIAAIMYRATISVVKNNMEKLSLIKKWKSFMTGLSAKKFSWKKQSTKLYICWIIYTDPCRNLWKKN